MNILAIETSCDETSCSIVKDGLIDCATVTATSAEMHLKTGGVVPEIAARKQVESIVPVIDACLKEANMHGKNDIDAIAVTYGPGLIGSLIVGVEAAKSLALSWDKPLIPVNHLIGHIYGNFVNNPDVQSIEFPAVVLIVSGGHTDLVLMHNHGLFTYLGGTLDDAAGEAFDKVARMLGLSKYLGGVELSKLAASVQGNTLPFKLPRPLIDSNSYDFSFSGLKTAVKRVVDAHPVESAAIAFDFENAVVDVLTYKTIKAAHQYKVKTILLGGGVSANTKLRSRFIYEAKKKPYKVFTPALKYCGDSAAYIASAAYFNPTSVSYADLQPRPDLSIMGTFPEVIHRRT